MDAQNDRGDDVEHEAAIRDIYVQSINRTFNSLDFILEMTEIGRKDRRSNFQRSDLAKFFHPSGEKAVGLMPMR
jgi:hypothetical protein